MREFPAEYPLDAILPAAGAALVVIVDFCSEFTTKSYRAAGPVESVLERPPQSLPTPDALCYAWVSEGINFVGAESECDRFVGRVNGRASSLAFNSDPEHRLLSPA